MVETKVFVKELLAANIKSHRKKIGFSQEKLAEAADLSTQTISDIEGCRTWVSDKTLENLANVLNIAVFQLFLPLHIENDNNPISFFYNHFIKLRSDIKEDIDKRMEQFLSNVDSHNIN